jgi:hypothetical protein
MPAQPIQCTVLYSMTLYCSIPTTASNPGLAKIIQLQQFVLCEGARRSIYSTFSYGGFRRPAEFRRACEEGTCRFDFIMLCPDCLHLNNARRCPLQAAAPAPVADPFESFGVAPPVVQTSTPTKAAPSSSQIPLIKAPPAHHAPAAFDDWWESAGGSPRPSASAQVTTRVSPVKAAPAAAPSSLPAIHVRLPESTSSVTSSGGAARRGSTHFHGFDDAEASDEEVAEDVEHELAAMHIGVVPGAREQRARSIAATLAEAAIAAKATAASSKASTAPTVTSTGAGSARPPVAPQKPQPPAASGTGGDAGNRRGSASSVGASGSLAPGA